MLTGPGCNLFRNQLQDRMIHSASGGDDGVGGGGGVEPTPLGRIVN